MDITRKSDDYCWSRRWLSARRPNIALSCAAPWIPLSRWRLPLFIANKLLLLFFSPFRPPPLASCSIKSRAARTSVTFTLLMNIKSGRCHLGARWALYIYILLRNSLTQPTKQLTNLLSFSLLDVLWFNFFTLWFNNSLRCLIFLLRAQRRLCCWQYICLEREREKPHY